MELSSLNPSAKNKGRKRLGRGPGSGHGKTAGKGHKGQNARSGGGTRPGFEGGQMPLLRKIPKRGFNNIIFGTDYAIVNVCDLNKFEANEVVTLSKCIKKGLIPASSRRLKVLSNGILTKSVVVKTHKISKVAAEKIIAVNGKVEVIDS